MGGLRSPTSPMMAPGGGFSVAGGGGPPPVNPLGPMPEEFTQPPSFSGYASTPGLTPPPQMNPWVAGVGRFLAGLGGKGPGVIGGMQEDKMKQWQFNRQQGLSQSLGKRFGDSMAGDFANAGMFDNALKAYEIQGKEGGETSTPENWGINAQKDPELYPMIQMMGRSAKMADKIPGIITSYRNGTLDRALLPLILPMIQQKIDEENRTKTRPTAPTKQPGTIKIR